MKLCREIVSQFRQAESAFLQQRGTAVDHRHQILQDVTDGEAQDLALGWYQIENEIVCAPAAEGCFWPAVLLEALLPQLPTQLVVFRLGDHPADHIHILGGPDIRHRLIRDQHTGHGPDATPPGNSGQVALDAVTIQHLRSTPAGSATSPAGEPDLGLSQEIPGARRRCHHRRSDQPEVLPRLD